MDVLHLIRPWVRPPRPERGGHASTDASLIACRTLIGAVGGASPVLAVGPAAGERRAALLGLVTHDRIAAPAGSLRLARPAARAFVADRGAPDAVCCWAPGLEVLAAAMVGRRARILSPRLDDLALADTGGPTEGGVDSRIAARAGLGLPPGGFILGLLGTTAIRMAIGMEPWDAAAAG